MIEFTRIYATTENNKNDTTVGASDAEEAVKTADTGTVESQGTDVETSDSGTMDTLDTDTLDTGNDSNQPGESGHSVSSSDLDNQNNVFHGDSNGVSDSDVEAPTETAPDVLSSEVGYQTSAQTDYSATLTHIDGALTLIVFLMLFYWCEHKISIAVRYFTGKGIN